MESDQLEAIFLKISAWGKAIEAGAPSGDALDELRKLAHSDNDALCEAVMNALDYQEFKLSRAEDGFSDEKPELSLSRIQRLEYLADKLGLEIFEEPSPDALDAHNDAMDHVL